MSRHAKITGSIPVVGIFFLAFFPRFPFLAFSIFIASDLFVGFVMFLLSFTFVRLSIMALQIVASKMEGRNLMTLIEKEDRSRHQHVVTCEVRLQ